jgi:hypothetical protein
MSLHLFYSKLHTKFEINIKSRYHKNKNTFENDWSIWCSNLLHIENLMYYDYNMHNLTICKYLLNLH